jgi:hypothetical protein
MGVKFYNNLWYLKLYRWKVFVRTVKYLRMVQLQIPFIGTILNTFECNAYLEFKLGMQIMSINKEHGQLN